MTDKEIISRLEHIIAVQNERIRQLIADTRKEKTE